MHASTHYRAILVAILRSARNVADHRVYAVPVVLHPVYVGLDLF